ncbi:MAG: septum formation family protein [Nocardioidaceae bacterium]
MTRPLRPPVARRVHAALASLAAVAALSGCSSGTASSAGPPSSPGGPTSNSPSTPPAATSPPAPKPAPPAGACRRLTYSAISHYSNADPTVPCKSPHTAYTFAVRRLPPQVDVTGVSIGNKSVQSAASQGCRDAYSRFIGGDPATRALARLSVTYFLPAQVEFDRGAHWVRCDVVALATARSLADLPDGLSGFLDSPTALQRYGVCSAGPPGEPSSVLLICTEQHTYRALTALRLGTDSARYPGEGVVRTNGQQRCSAYIAARLGPAGGYTFGWTYPTAADWALGQRFGYCWQKTGN